MFRILHLADIHLGAAFTALGEHATERRRDLQNALSRAVDYALDARHHIHAVVIAGDLFDTATPPNALVDDALQEIGRLAQAGLPTIIAPGNHDALGMPHSVYNQRAADFARVAHVATSPTPELITCVTLAGTRVAFYGMAWQPHLSQPPYDAFRATAPAELHIAVLHATLDTAQGLELHSRDVPVSLARLAETGMDYIALGHIHRYQKHTAGRTVVVYPGTIEGLRFTAGETGERCLAIVDVRAGQPATVERIPWNRRTVALETVDLSTRGLETADELARYIREHLAGEERITRLRLQGTAPFVVDAEALQERLQDAFFALDLIDESDAFQSHEVLAWADEPTIRGACVRRLQQKLEDATDDTERQKAELALKLVVRALAGDPGR